MRRRKNTGRVLAGILAVGLLVSSMPSAVYAVESESDTAVVVEQEETVPEENGEEAGQGSAGTDLVEKNEPEAEEESADSTDTTPEEEGKGKQEESATDSEQTEGDDEAEEVETEVEAEEPETAEVNTEVSAYASGTAVTASGTCGENVTWTLTEDHTLTISGTGNMESYRSKRPWQEFCDEVERVIIEEGVTSVGGYAFMEFSKLEKIQIAESVTEIGMHAFAGCPGVTDIDLPGSLTTIKTAAFEQCTGLCSVMIPEGVTEIGNIAFADCTSLSSVVIPASVSKMGNGTVGAFKGCVNLHTAGPIGQGTYDIAFGWTEQIPSYAFDSSMIESICLPQGLTQIGGYAFWCCKELYRVDIPEGVVKIGAGAFEYCEKLAELVLPRSIMAVDSNTFSHCEGLTDVYYGGSEEEWEGIEVEHTTHYGIRFSSNPTIHYNSTGSGQTINGILRSSDTWEIHWECTYKSDSDGNPYNGRVEISVNDTNTVEELYLYNEASNQGFPWELAPYNIPKSAISTISIRGKPTKKLHITTNSFKGYSGLDKVVFEYVSGIDSGAFEDCTSLRFVGF